MSIINTYRSYLFGSVLMIVVVVAIGSLSLVWMRQQVSHAAYRTQSLERTLSQLERQNSNLDSKIAMMHNPNNLRQLADALLKLPRKSQIVWVEPEAPTREHKKLLEDRFGASSAVAYKYEN